MRFGQFLRQYRKNQQKTLREFCISNSIDPGVWSKLERSKLPPPQDNEELAVIARFLGITEGSDDWKTLNNLATAEKGYIQDDLITDEELVRKLPIFFRTKRSNKVSDNEFDVVIEIVKEVEDGY